MLSTRISLKIYARKTTDSKNENNRPKFFQRIIKTERNRLAKFNRIFQFGKEIYNEDLNSLRNRNKNNSSDDEEIIDPEIVDTVENDDDDFFEK